MKVEILEFTNSTSANIDDRINKFIKDKNIIDIKFATAYNKSVEGIDIIIQSFLIMYKDTPN